MAIGQVITAQAYARPLMHAAYVSCSMYAWSFNVSTNICTHNDHIHCNALIMASKALKCALELVNNNLHGPARNVYSTSHSSSATIQSHLCHLSSQADGSEHIIQESSAMAVGVAIRTALCNAGNACFGPLLEYCSALLNICELEACTVGCGSGSDSDRGEFLAFDYGCWSSAMLPWFW